MTQPLLSPGISPWWRRAVVIVLVFGFAILITLSVRAYRIGPPVPDRAVTPSGEVLFTGDDVRAGQEVFLMAVGFWNFVGAGVFGFPLVVATLMAYWFSVRAPKGTQQPSAAK
jgi:nitric oxide reductase large subunit